MDFTPLSVRSTEATWPFLMILDVTVFFLSFGALA